MSSQRRFRKRIAHENWRQGDHEDVPRFRRLACVFCGAIYYQQNSLLRHIFTAHSCIHCQECCVDLANHSCQPSQVMTGGNVDFDPSPFVRSASAIDNLFQVFELSNLESYTSVEVILSEKLNDIDRLLSQCLQVYTNIKFQINMKILMMEYFSKGKEYKFFNSNMHPLLHQNNITPFVVQSGNQIIRQLNAFVELSSTWSVLQIEQIKINVAANQPEVGGRNIPLPADLKRRKGIANIPVKTECFKYCVYAVYLGLYRKCDIENLNTYDTILLRNANNEIIDFRGVGPLVSIKDIDVFERKNPTFSCNVFGFADKTTFPLRIVEERKQYHMNLLLYHSKNESTSHYLYIFNIDTFLNKDKTHKFFFCLYCLGKFRIESQRDVHQETCKKYGCRRLEFYKQGHFETVNLSSYSMPSPVTVYFDIESIINKEMGNGTNVEATVVPFAYGLIVVTQDSTVLEHSMYVGRDADKRLVKEMIRIGAKYIKENQTHKSNIVMNDEAHGKMGGNVCCICDDVIQEDEMKVRHHNHASVRVLGTPPAHVFGPAHQSCNLSARQFSHVPFLSHNFAKFDSLQLIKGLAQNTVQDIQCIARSSSNFINIKFNDCSLMDTYLALPFSLKECVRILKESGLHNFKCTQFMFSNYREHIEDIIKKQFFPYDYITFHNMFDRLDELPAIENFHNTLTNESLSLEDYLHAQKMFKLFDCHSLADYCKIYLMLDITLLCDIFNHHRKLCLDSFKVEALHFLSTPSMAFRLALGTSGAKLEYISDLRVYTSFKQSLRGGIVNFGTRYTESNCKELPNYDPTKEPRCIASLDVSQLYSYAMLHKLPVGEFYILNEDEMRNFDIFGPGSDDEYGYLLTVDITIDPDYHDYLDQFPPMPQQLVIDQEKASIVQRSLTDEEGNSFIKQFKNVQLSLNLYDKKNYVLHLFILQLYLRIPGIILTKVHQIIRYKQEAFMKDFIEMASRKRRETNDAAMKNYWKLQCNSSYGYSAVKIEDFRDIFLVKSRNEAKSRISKPNFKGFTVVCPGLVVVESTPLKIKIRNHIAVASAILDWSKHRVYESWYFGFKPYFLNINVDASLLYQDTDCFNFTITMHYEELIEHLSKIKINGEILVDMSFLPRDHPLYSDSIKSKVGYWHSEVENNIIMALVVLRKKCYAMRIHDCEDKLRGKGIQKSILRSNFCFDSYKDVLFKGETKRVQVKIFRRQDQTIQLVCSEKIAFTSFTTSRFLLPPDGQYTKSWGHKDLLNGEMIAIIDE